MDQVGITFAPAEALRSRFASAATNASDHARALRGLRTPEIPLGVALLVLDSTTTRTDQLGQGLDGVIAALRSIDDGPSASGLVPFGTLDEAARSRVGQDLAVQARAAIEAGDGERLAEVVGAMAGQGEDAAWAFWQELGTEHVSEALDELALVDPGAPDRRPDLIALLGAGDRAGAFGADEQRALIEEVRSSTNGRQLAYDLLIEEVGTQATRFSDDFTYTFIEHVWATHVYVDQAIDVLGAADGRPELTIRLLTADPETWGDAALGELGDAVDTPTVARSIFTNDVFDEPGTAAMRTLLDSDRDLAGRDAAALAIVRTVASDEADFTDGYRPLLADLYGQYREDVTDGIGLHPYEGAQAQLAGRDGIELGGEEIRRYLAEVALDDEAWERVTVIAGEEQARLSALVGQGSGAGETGNDAAVFRTSGRLQAVVLLSRNDALLHQGEAAAERREDLVAGLDAIVTAATAVTDPVGTAVDLASEYGPELVATVLVPDGDVPPIADAGGAIPGASAESFRADYNGIVADVAAGGGGENPIEVDRRIIAEAQAYNDSLPPAERFLAPDGTVPTDLTAEQEAHLVRFGAGVPGSGRTTYAGTFDGKHPAGDWLHEYAESEPGSSDHV